MARASILGTIFGEIARAAGNVNPITVEKKHKDLVHDLRSMEPLFPIFLPRRGYKFKKIKVNGVKTEIFRPKKDASENVVFVLHGGAYISRMMFYYRLLNKRYSIASNGGTVIHHDYRCAPEYLYPAAIDDTMTVWNWILDQGYKAENVILVGDSAGGHLVMNLLLKLHDEGREMPRAAIVMSPWIDMTASGPSYVENYKVDPVFGIRGQTPGPDEVKELLAKSELFMWFGDQPRDDRYISPALAEYDSTFPPMFITAGGNEMLLSEAQTLASKLKEQGIEVVEHYPAGMFHAYPIYELFPEAQQAIKMICKYINTQFNK